MKFRDRISRKWIIRLVLFIALIGMAGVFDNYLEKHPEALKELNSEKSNENDPVEEHGTIYLFSQMVNYSVKSSLQKNYSRKIFEQSHNKLVQWWHQMRNHQVLKIEKLLPFNSIVLPKKNIIIRFFYADSADDDRMSH